MSDVSCWPCRSERSRAPERTNAIAATATEPMEGNHDRSRGRGHFGLPAALRALRLPADLCPTGRAQATNPGRRGPLRSGEPGRLRVEGLDAERLYKVATIAIHFEAYKLPGPICMPACCRPWGALEPACPPGPGRP